MSKHPFLSFQFVMLILLLGGFGAGMCQGQQGSGSIPADPTTRTRKGKPPAATGSEGAVTSVPEDFAKVKLAPGVLLHFGVYNAPEMEATLRVAADGSILVPLAGSVQVGGMSVTDARTKIRSALIAGEFIKEPQVTLDILQLAPGFVTILGEVQTPGRFQILASTTLDSALALAGGETLEAGGNISIQRSDRGPNDIEHVQNDGGTDDNGLAKITVAPGDVIRVSRAGVIYVLGSVHRPGGYLMLNKGSLNLLEAVSLAGGTMLESADTVRILHRHGDEVVEEKVKLSDATKGKRLSSVLSDKDIVYVPSNLAKSLFVNGSVIIGAAASSLLYRVP